jgi:hypothetical protein
LFYTLGHHRFDIASWRLKATKRAQISKRWPNLKYFTSLQMLFYKKRTEHPFRLSALRQGAPILLNFCRSRFARAWQQFFERWREVVQARKLVQYSRMWRTTQIYYPSTISGSVLTLSSKKKSIYLSDISDIMLDSVVCCWWFRGVQIKCSWNVRLSSHKNRTKRDDFF